jgi:hypothetical protein
MKCADCKRPLLRATLQLPTRAGVLSFGPTCAKRYIVRPTRSAFKVIERRQPERREVDPRQLALELVA